MGKVLSVVARQVKMFNIEDRAYKVISKEKPVPAPIHEKTVKEIEMMIKENPTGISELQKKDENLDLHLKTVYVVSHDPKTTFVKSEKHRPLPQIRQSSSNLEFGYVEPDENSVPEGKFTLKQALQFLSDHQSQPQVHTAEVIAKQYKIDQNLAENMVRYYSMFGLYIPKGKQEKVEKVPDSMANLTSANIYRVVTAQIEKDKQISEKVNAEIEKDKQISEKVNAEIEKDKQISEKVNAEIEKDKQISEKVNAEIEKDKQISEKVNAEIEKEKDKNEKVS